MMKLHCQDASTAGDGQPPGLAGSARPYLPLVVSLSNLDIRLIGAKASCGQDVRR
jgi:hypothetical protein